MSDAAKQAIFGRLRQGRGAAPVQPLDLSPLGQTSYGDAKSKLDKFITMISAVNGEVHTTTRTDWPVRMRAILQECGVKSLAYGPKGPQAETIRSLSNGVDLLAFDRKVEAIKDKMFAVHAGFTATHGGIAETGSLILRTSPEEPRQLSLVPPIHIALLDATRLYDTFWQAQTQDPDAWAKDMPTNALLISGPSKTADIEQTLTYGVHGPKRLIVLAVTNGLS